MTRGVFSRLKSIADGAFRLLRDMFFLRLSITALRLWSVSWLLATVLAAFLCLCLIGAGFGAKTVFLAVRPATDWLIWPLLASALAFIVLLELCSASLMNALHGVLRLSYDVGRHRIGVLLSLTTVAFLALALAALRPGAGAAGDAILLWGLALTMLALALWFERVYRRPAYPGFRDFHGDVVSARQHFAQAAHVG